MGEITQRKAVDAVSKVQRVLAIAQDVCELINKHLEETK